jgi:N-acetylmuramoyl-L-alanine amidase
VLTVLGFYLSVQVVYARIYKDPDPGTWKVQPVEDPAKSKSSTESITPFSTEEHLVPVKEKLLLTEENERGELITVSAGYKAIEPSVRTESGNLVLRTDPGKILKVVLDPGHGGRDDASQVAGIYEKDLTLEFAKVIRKVLQERGFEVVLTVKAMSLCL